MLVAGGANGRYPVNSAEIYDPTANTWTFTGNMTIGRYAHTATLSDGRHRSGGGRNRAVHQLRKGLYGLHPYSQGRDLQRGYGHLHGYGKPESGVGVSVHDAANDRKGVGNGGIGTTTICCVVLNTA